MEYIRPFFCIRVGGFSAAEFILLTIILIISTCVFKRNEKVFQIYYTEPKSNIPTDKFNKVLCEINLSFNKTIPWMILIVSNVHYWFPRVTYFTIGCIVVNIVVILLLLKHDRNSDAGYNTSTRLVAFLCCLARVYYTIEPLTKDPKKKKKKK